MGIVVQRAGGRRVRVSNPSGVVYVKGSEFVDGSLRLIPDTLDENVEFQRRINGVWNATGIQIAASSIHLGRDLRISGAGEFISTLEVISGTHALIPHVRFDDLGTSEPRVPVLEAKTVRFVVQPDDLSEVIGTELTTLFFSPIKAMRARLYLKTGSIGATVPVQFTIRRQSATGTIVFQKDLPVSLMAVPNTEFQIELDELTQVNAGDFIHSAFASEAPISLASDPSGAFFLALDFCRLTEENLLTDTLVLSNDLGIVFSNSLELARPNAVFST